MKTIDIDTLNQVTGGLTKSAELTTALTSIQSSIKDLGSNNNNQSSNLLLPVMMLAMQKRNSPSVISAGGATVVAG